jgi:hypothetical protein
VVNPNVALKRWQNGGKSLPVLKLHRIEEFNEEYTNGEIEDWVYFRPSFYPVGKPEGSRSGVAKGLQ